ncbi:hypothetical protein M409DRAFT_49534 [Zasmidium cellare ATCC 36951]|uniref:Uncharacterized protein n=1 Tax=Zasmidium cellare ATCC 36951 TaxID=1080233 RepID=A0A6A6D1H8_ZASCE|nr:uncharacterized protein M409DRAFT_49534 [Zasmidium cellare ATCC 36951]KAF2173035.1 hypothetical protein M409DRAFT_49534 [Zasmidium cellare ATCC 36951]
MSFVTCQPTTHGMNLRAAHRRPTLCAAPTTTAAVPSVDLCGISSVRRSHFVLHAAERHQPEPLLHQSNLAVVHKGTGNRAGDPPCSVPALFRLRPPPAWTNAAALRSQRVGDMRPPIHRRRTPQDVPDNSPIRAQCVVRDQAKAPASRLRTAVPRNCLQPHLAYLSQRRCSLQSLSSR